MKGKGFALLVCVIVSLVAVSCSEPNHEHSYEAEWKGDATSHWHECSCGDKTDVAEHDWWSEWLNPDDLSSSTRECLVCHRSDTIVGWDGTACSWVTNYDTNASTGFLETGAGKVAEKIPSSITDAHKKNAKDFIEYFTSNLIDKGKIAIDTANETATPATVTVRSADALASLGLLDRYFAAISIVESDTDTTKSNYYKGLFTTGTNVKVYVDTDMDLRGGNWTTVRCSYSIDFQNHTIYNLKCIHPYEDYVGLFGDKLSFDASVSNLVVRNARVEGRKYVGIVYSNATFISVNISNVQIFDSSVTGFKWVGGVIGYAYVGTISNVALDNVTVLGDDREIDGDTSYQVGGIAGFLLYGDISSCTVKNSTIKASKEAGGIAGRAYIQDEVPINVTGNTVAQTQVANLEGASADSFIGYKSAYLGYVCGGKYLGLTEPTDTYEGYPNSENSTMKCTIKDNTVDGVTK